MAAGGICVQPPWSPSDLSVTCLTCCPFLFPNVYQTVPQTVYVRCLYKKKFYNSCECIHCFFWGWWVAVGFFFSSFSLLFSYDWMTIFSPALELLFLLCVYIYDINRFLVCRNHETLIQQSTYTCMIALSC